ncbi:MAG: TIGR00296 family protein [Methanolobus sp.]|nr:TIGR00296 family protein [Methanolobus sp.]
MFSDYEGKAAVRLARNSIETYLRTGKTLNSSESHLPAIFNEARGVFVTLTKKGQLRGCIGYPYADVSLSHAIVDSALSAALRDPRFPPVTIDEMGNIYVELTILTRPEIMDVVPKDLPSSIKIGRHGLIVKSSHRQGLLLPQVAVENDFDEIEFLGHTCLKAGLPHDAWMMGVDVYSFEGQIFSEKEPGGEIVEKDISKKTCSND